MRGKRKEVLVRHVLMSEDIRKMIKAVKTTEEEDDIERERKGAALQRGSPLRLSTRPQKQ